MIGMWVVKVVECFFGTLVLVVCKGLRGSLAFYFSSLPQTLLARTWPVPLWGSSFRASFTPVFLHSQCIACSVFMCTATLGSNHQIKLLMKILFVFFKSDARVFFCNFIKSNECLTKWICMTEIKHQNYSISFLNQKHI